MLTQYFINGREVTKSDFLDRALSETAIEIGKIIDTGEVIILNGKKFYTQHYEFSKEELEYFKALFNYKAPEHVSFRRSQEGHLFITWDNQFTTQMSGDDILGFLKEGNTISGVEVKAMLPKDTPAKFRGYDLKCPACGNIDNFRQVGEDKYYDGTTVKYDHDGCSVTDGIVKTFEFKCLNCCAHFTIKENT